MSSRPLPDDAQGPADAPVVLHDVDVAASLVPADAVAWIGDAIDAQHRGDLVAPPRIEAELHGGALVFTTGQLRGRWFGYRSYDRFGTESGSQVVVVHEERSGSVTAIAVGIELGRRRTGAIGGVAADLLASPRASVVAVIGSGFQAETQLWALAAVRGLDDVRVSSPDRTRRERFAARMSEDLSLRCRAVSSAEDAVIGADVVVLATSSATPVIDARWIAPGTYVTTIGPKQLGRAEFGLDLAERGDLLVCDSPAQVDAYTPPHVLAGTPHRTRLVSLGALRAGEVELVDPDEVRVFFSVGLAGTEAFLLDRLAGRLRR